MSTDDLPRGIDVASYQGRPDWAAVAASGIRFAFTKATEDVDYTNPTLGHNWAGIKANGIVRGAYHYARPERGNSMERAHAEADYFMATVLRAGGLETGDMLVLDLEPTVRVSGAAAWSLAWLERVERLAGVKPLVYTGPWVIQQQGLDAHTELGEYGLWLAAYQSTMPRPLAPWDTVAFWQYSSTGRVPGIAGDVDLNVFNGAPDRLALYGKPGEIVLPVPIPGLMPAQEPDLATLVGVAYHEDGVIIPALEGARASGDWSQVDAAVKFLRENNPHRAA